MFENFFKNLSYYTNTLHVDETTFKAFEPYIRVYESETGECVVFIDWEKIDHYAFKLPSFELSLLREALQYSKLLYFYPPPLAHNQHTLLWSPNKKDFTELYSQYFILDEIHEHGCGYTPLLIQALYDRLNNKEKATFFKYSDIDLAKEMYERGPLDSLRTELWLMDSDTLDCSSHDALERSLQRAKPLKVFKKIPNKGPDFASQLYNKHIRLSLFQQNIPLELFQINDLKNKNVDYLTIDKKYKTGTNFISVRDQNLWKTINITMAIGERNRSPFLYLLEANSYGYKVLFFDRHTGKFSIDSTSTAEDLNLSTQWNARYNYVDLKNKIQPNSNITLSEIDITRELLQELGVDIKQENSPISYCLNDIEKRKEFRFRLFNQTERTTTDTRFSFEKPAPKVIK